MDLSTITVQDFKNVFFRDFPYLRAWSASKTYNAGDEVSYNSLIYRSLLSSNTNKNPATQTTYWTKIESYESNYVLDDDIEKSFNETDISFNQDLFSNDDNVKLGYLYLSAHYMVLDLQASNEGLKSSGSFPVNSRSVGSVSESYSIPDKFLNDPNLVFYTRTKYGLKYLNMILPYLVGNFNTIGGGIVP